jgi:hypothetical protein
MGRRSGRRAHESKVREQQIPILPCHPSRSPAVRDPPHYKCSGEPSLYERRPTRTPGTMSGMDNIHIIEFLTGSRPVGGDRWQTETTNLQQSIPHLDVLSKTGALTWGWARDKSLGSKSDFTMFGLDGIALHRHGHSALRRSLSRPPSAERGGCSAPANHAMSPGQAPASD